MLICDLMRLSEYHARFAGGTRWRVTLDGVELEGQGVLCPTPRMLEITSDLLAQHADQFATASKEYKVPVELLIASALTQSPDGPRNFVWRSPIYLGDTVTPDLISAGIFRFQLSTAHRCMKDPTLDHNWLLNVGNALQVAARSIRFDFITLRTRWDPILVACAFNAGGLFEDQYTGTWWRMRTYSMLFGFPPTKAAMVADTTYAEVFARNFCAARQLVDGGALAGREFVGFRSVIEKP